MFYIWILFLTLILLLVAFVVVARFVQRHQQRKAIETRGYRVAGDPNVDPRSADEP